MSNVTSDATYLDLREARNMLTHRVAPGRTFFIGIGTDDELPDQWKLNNITLDGNMAATRRAGLARLLTRLLRGADQFVARHL